MPSHTEHSLTSSDSSQSHHAERFLARSLTTGNFISGLATCGESRYTLVLQAVCIALNFFLISISHVLSNIQLPAFLIPRPCTPQLHA